VPRLAVLAAAPLVLSAQDDGLRPVIGGLPFDSGFALGLEYESPLFARDRLGFRTKAIGSVKEYGLVEAVLTASRLAGGRLFVEARARYRNYPEEDFWGLGAKASRHRRTTFRLEDFDCTATFGFRPQRALTFGIAGVLLKANTGPGRDADFPSVERVFSATEVPALDRQPHYLHGTAFVRADYRDDPEDATRGGYYELRGTYFHDRRFDRFHFRRYQLDLRQFLPAFAQDTIAIRSLAVVSHKQRDRLVPFFLQPTVGGGNDLRGYRQYRFRDENALTFNLEYRRRMGTVFQLVGFADAGQVFPEPARMGVRGMRGSVGVGARVRFAEIMALGIEIGWSPEGLRLWFRSAPIF